MSDEKTGLEKMVEWLEYDLADDEALVSKLYVKGLLDKARQLAKEEVEQEEKDKHMPFMEYFNGLPQEEKDRVLRDFKELEKARKPAAPAGLVGLVGELHTATDRYVGWMSGVSGVNLVNEIQEILSRYDGKAQEPLAELADRKGLWVEIKNYEKAGWSITLRMEQTAGIMRTVRILEKDVCSDKNYLTYAEAESKARAYLEGLDDRKGG